MKGKLYPVDVYSVAALRKADGHSQSDAVSGRRRKQRRAGTQGLASGSAAVALSTTRTRSTDAATISKIRFKQMVGRHHEMEQVPCLLMRLSALACSGLLLFALICSCSCVQYGVLYPAPASFMRLATALQVQAGHWPLLLTLAVCSLPLHMNAHT